jgi:hypothetical protein
MYITLHKILDNSLGNQTYTTTILTEAEILDTLRSLLCCFGISTKQTKIDLPSLYWISNLNSECPYIVILLDLPNAQ